MIKWIFGHRGHHRLYKLRQGALGMSLVDPQLSNTVKNFATLGPVELAGHLVNSTPLPLCRI